MALTLSTSVGEIIPIPHSIKSGLPAEHHLNYSYGDDPKQVMDIYLPENRTPKETKLLVLVHGGGWNNGDKRDFSNYISELQKRLPDYAVANLNYRLFNIYSGANKFPTQENDIKLAVDLLLSKAKEFNISEKYVLLGASAGAHLSMLQGYKYQRPEAIISFFGPSDLVHLYKNPVYPALPLLLNALVGSTPESNPSLYHDSSPINFITHNSPPTIVLQGGRDKLVPESQSALLVKKLKEEGVVHEYIYYKDESHGWRGATLSDSFDKIEGFLKIYVE